MDELKIESTFLTSLISRILTKQINKKLGMKAKIEIESVAIEKDENDYIFNLKAKGRVPAINIVDLTKDLL